MVPHPRIARVMLACVLAIGLAPALVRGQQKKAGCQLRCNVTTESYTVDLTCEKGGSSEKVSDQQKYEYTASGAVGALVLTLNHERTYSTSNRTYHIAGSIRIDKTAGTASYDIQATGGLLGPETATCKAGSAGAHPGRSAAGIAAPSVRPASPRDKMLNLRVAAGYQPAITVPFCVDALKNSQTPVFACFVSEPGEYIGQGKTWLLPSQNPPASAEVFFERVSVSVPDPEGKWEFRFSTPRESPWKAGLFDNAMRDSFHDEQHPGLAVSGHSRGCSEVAGRFEVLELVTDSDGRKIQKFAADFEQICSGKRLQGIVRLNSTIDR